MKREELDTMVAGVRCREVLADLSDFVDGELSAEREAVLRAHLAECDRCARFGGAVARVITSLRMGLREPTWEGGDELVRAVLATVRPG